MRRTVLSTALAALATIAASLVTVPQATAAPIDDVTAKLQTIPGLRIESSSVVGGKPFFVLRYRQPADHRRPNGETFEQRITLWHRDFAAPTVLHTTGYGGVAGAFTSEPTALLNANQLNVEQRFFNASTPASQDWSKLTIWQAATDHHRIVQAFKKALYAGKWVSTGASKGGMTSVYHRRFYPNDVYATVAYVAPQDVINEKDVYTEFIQQAGTDRSCNAALRTMQRTALQRRATMVPMLAAYFQANNLTVDSTFGSVDRAFEGGVLDTPFVFWQYGTQAGCPTVPTASATDQEIFDFIDVNNGWFGYTDEGTGGFLPYYFQATKQLNWPNTSQHTWWLKGLLHYKEASSAPTAVPDAIEPRHEPFAMRDIDQWLKRSGQRMLFVYGQNDPWSSEKFEPGRGTRDSHWYTVPAGNHGSNIGQLPATQRTDATRILQTWMGVTAKTTPATAAIRDPGARKTALLR